MNPWVTTSDTAALAFVAAVAVVPFAVVFIVAMIRGYTIHLSMRRPIRARRRRRDQD